MKKLKKFGYALNINTVIILNTLPGVVPGNEKLQVNAKIGILLHILFNPVVVQTTHHHAYEQAWWNIFKSSGDMY